MGRKLFGMNSDTYQAKKAADEALQAVTDLSDEIPNIVDEAVTVPLQNVATQSRKDAIMFGASL